jgi:hypothetical protein
MVIMGRAKKAVGQNWKAVNEQRDKERAKQKEESGQEKSKEITPEEHEERLRKLKKLGLLK